MFELILGACSILSEFGFYHLFDDGLQRLLEKKAGGISRILLSVSVMIYMAFLYTWLPHKFGSSISFLDDAIILEPGALSQSLTILCGFAAFAVVFGLLAHIWQSMRRKMKFSGRLFFLQVLFSAIFIYAAVLLSKTNKVIEFNSESDTAFMIGFIVVGIFLVWRIKSRLFDVD